MSNNSRYEYQAKRSWLYDGYSQIVGSASCIREVHTFEIGVQTTTKQMQSNQDHKGCYRAILQ